MVPPGFSHYFYSFGGLNGEAEVARDQPHKKTKNIKNVRDIKFKEIDGRTLKPVEFFCSFKLKSVNYVQAVQQTVLNQYYEPLKFQVVYPRLADSLYLIPFEIRPRTPWSIPISLFNEYQLETD